MSWRMLWDNFVTYGMQIGLLIGLAEEAEEPLHRIFLILTVVVAAVVVGTGLDAWMAARQPALGDARSSRLEARVDVDHHRPELLHQRRQRRHRARLPDGFGGARRRRVGGLRVGGE